MHFLIIYYSNPCILSACPCVSANKVIASLQALWLLDQLESVRDKTEVETFEARKSELRQLLETDEEALSAIYKWYVLKCPQGLLRHVTNKKTKKKKGDDKYAGLKVAVNGLWGDRVSPFYWQDALILFLSWPILQLLKCFAVGRHLRPSKILHCCFPEKNPELLDLLKAAHRQQQAEPLADIGCRHWFSCRCRQKNDQDGLPQAEREELPQEAVDKFDYEFVWFNAWLYSGSSTLWAGLIMELYKATETHFGNDYANAQIKAKFYRALFYGIVTGALLGLSIFLATFNVEYEVVNFSQVVAPVISGIARNYRIVSPCSLQN